jgi:hypothetical protein
MAARRGCDAVIVLDSKKKIISRRGWYLMRQGYRASCVVFTSQPRVQALAAL